MGPMEEKQPAEAPSGTGGDAAPAPDQPAPAPRSKKLAKRSRWRAGPQDEVGVTSAQTAHVRTVRTEPRKDGREGDDGPRVLLSKTGKAPQLQLSDDRLSVTGHKGFRTVRASHGAYKGTWYCEARVNHLGKSGHVRLGWCTRRAELQAPVGFDEHGFCYRDLEGSRVHKGLREAYGEAYGEGDVIGLLLHLPEGGRPLEVLERSVVRWKGALYYKDEGDPQPQPLKGSMVAFSRNGQLQGVAYADIPDGTYYAAASLYTLPDQAQGASVTFNFGPNFQYAPPQLEGCGPARPVSELASQQAAEGAAAAAGAVQASAAAAGVPA